MFVNSSDRCSNLGARFLFPVFLLLGACTSPFKADVTRFHTNPVVAGEAVLITPEDEALHGLEFNRYADMVGAKLAEIGYGPAGDETPDLVVRLNYGIVNLGEQERSGGTSVGVGVGRQGRSTGFGLGTIFDLSGDGGNVYEYFLVMELDDPHTGGRLFEGRVVSQGSNNDLTAVMPLLVMALFDNYPGQSGKTETIRIKTND